MSLAMYTKAQALNSEISDIAVPIEDENGGIAIQYRQTVRVLTKCGKTEYVFVTNANVCMSWVKAGDAQCILDKRGGCCGQKRPGVFTYANAASVRRWTNGGGR